MGTAMVATQVFPDARAFRPDVVVHLLRRFKSGGVGGWGGRGAWGESGRSTAKIGNVKCESRKYARRELEMRTSGVANANGERRNANGENPNYERRQFET